MHNTRTQELRARIDSLRERINYPRQTIRDRIAHARAQLSGESTTTIQEPEPTPVATSIQEPQPSLSDIKNKLRPKR